MMPMPTTCITTPIPRIKTTTTNTTTTTTPTRLPTLTNNHAHNNDRSNRANTNTTHTSYKTTNNITPITWVIHAHAYPHAHTHTTITTLTTPPGTATRPLTTLRTINPITATTHLRDDCQHNTCNAEHNAHNNNNNQNVSAMIIITTPRIPTKHNTNNTNTDTTETNDYTNSRNTTTNSHGNGHDAPDFHTLCTNTGTSTKTCSAADVFYSCEYRHYASAHAETKPNTNRTTAYDTHSYDNRNSGELSLLRALCFFPCVLIVFWRTSLTPEGGCTIRWLRGVL